MEVLKYDTFFSSAKLCAVSWLTFLNPMYCNVDLGLKHALIWNVLVFIRMYEKN